MGILSSIGRFVGGAPNIWKYVAIVVVASSILGGAVFYGYEKGVQKSNLVVASLQRDIAKLNQQIGEVILPIQTKIVTEYVTKIVHIKDTANTNTVIIHDVVPDTGILSAGWISAHNAAAQGLAVDPVAAADITPSGVTAKDALSVVNENYGVCIISREQVIAINSYLKQVHDAVDKINKRNSLNR